MESKKLKGNKRKTKHWRKILSKYLEYNEIYIKVKLFLGLR